MLLAATLTLSGAIGQSQPLDEEPISWCHCPWIADDGAGNVYLPDGWMVPAGTFKPVKTTREVRPQSALTGVPPAVDGFPWGANVHAKGRLPKSGDYVFATRYPDSRLHRVTADGQEVVDGLWPRKGYVERFAIADGELWGLTAGATLLTERLKVGVGTSVGGARDSRTWGIARGKDGWWLATTQGAHFYPDDGGGLYTHRIGGLGQPTALALDRGRVVAVFGCRILMFNLDDRPDEACDSGQSEWEWFVGGSWSTRVDGAEVRDGVFCLHEVTQDKSWAFDPTYTGYTDRGKRFHLIDEPVTARTQGGMICGYETTAVARQGRWTVAYVPAKKAILRYKEDK